MKEDSTAEKFFGSVFCFVIAGLIYNYVDSGIWRNIGIGFFVLGGFGAISEILIRAKVNRIRLFVILRGLKNIKLLFLNLLH